MSSVHGAFYDLLVKKKHFHSLNVLLKDADIPVSPWIGRNILVPNLQGSIELADLCYQIFVIYEKSKWKKMPIEEKRALKSLNDKIKVWYEITDEAVKKVNILDRLVDWPAYGRWILPSFSPRSMWEKICKKTDQPNWLQ